MIAEKSNSSTHNDLPESWRWEYDGDCPRAVNDAGGIISGHGRQWVIDTAWESNSSAPLTGWTRDWPTEPGWRGWIYRGSTEEIEPARTHEHRGNLFLECLSGEGQEKDFSDGVWFSMDKPPEPPKDTP